MTNPTSSLNMQMPWLVAGHKRFQFYFFTITLQIILIIHRRMVAEIKAITSHRKWCFATLWKLIAQLHNLHSH